MKRQDSPNTGESDAHNTVFSRHFQVPIFKSRFSGFSWNGTGQESEPVLKSLRLTTIAISSENIKKREDGGYKLRQQL